MSSNIWDLWSKSDADKKAAGSTRSSQAPLSSISTPSKSAWYGNPSSSSSAGPSLKPSQNPKLSTNLPRNVPPPTLPPKVPAKVPPNMPPIGDSSFSKATIQGNPGGYPFPRNPPQNTPLNYAHRVHHHQGWPSQPVAWSQPQLGTWTPNQHGPGYLSHQGPPASLQQVQVHPPPSHPHVPPFPQAPGLQVYQAPQPPQTPTQWNIPLPQDQFLQYVPHQNQAQQQHQQLQVVLQQQQQQQQQQQRHMELLKHQSAQSYEPMKQYSALKNVVDPVQPSYMSLAAQVKSHASPLFHGAPTYFPVPNPPLPHQILKENSSQDSDDTSASFQDDDLIETLALQQAEALDHLGVTDEEWDDAMSNSASICAPSAYGFDYLNLESQTESLLDIHRRLYEKSPSIGFRSGYVRPDDYTYAPMMSSSLIEAVHVLRAGDIETLKLASWVTSFDFSCPGDRCRRPFFRTIESIRGWLDMMIKQRVVTSFVQCSSPECTKGWSLQCVGCGKVADWTRAPTAPAEPDVLVSFCCPQGGSVLLWALLWGVSSSEPKKSNQDKAEAGAEEDKLASFSRDDWAKILKFVQDEIIRADDVVRVFKEFKMAMSTSASSKNNYVRQLSAAFIHRRAKVKLRGLEDVIKAATQRQPPDKALEAVRQKLRKSSPFSSFTKKRRMKQDSVLGKGVGYGPGYAHIDPSVTEAVGRQREARDSTVSGYLQVIRRVLVLPAEKFDGLSPRTGVSPELVEALFVRSPVLDIVADLLSIDSLMDVSQRLVALRPAVLLVQTLAASPCTAKLIFEPRMRPENPGGWLRAFSFVRDPSVVRDVMRFKRQPGKPICEILADLSYSAKRYAEKATQHGFNKDQDGRPDPLVSFFELVRQAENELDSRRAQLEYMDIDSPRAKEAQPDATGREKEDSSQFGKWHRENCVTEVADDKIMPNHAHAGMACRQSAGMDSAKGRMKRLFTEIGCFQDSLPEGVFVRHASSRMDVMKVLIVGPRDTPYSHGLFEFDVYCPDRYPHDPPAVTFKTTGNGRIRFNPNLYENGTGELRGPPSHPDFMILWPCHCGKNKRQLLTVMIGSSVCLSLLGTWDGEPWDPSTSTLLQIFVSIQAMILSERPWYNEPGRESHKNRAASDKYNAKITVEKVKHAMLPWLRPTGDLSVPSSRDDVWADVVAAYYTTMGETVLKAAAGWRSLFEPRPCKTIIRHLARFSGGQAASSALVTRSGNPSSGSIESSEIDELINRLRGALQRVGHQRQHQHQQQQPHQPQQKQKQVGKSRSF